MELTASMQAPSPLAPGYFLDRYELLCPIAEGGMAAVWVARLQAKHGFEKLFAIKTIRPEHAADARFQQMFLDEARIASKIEHTNVAQIIDLGEQNNILYIVMEWVDGESLARLAKTLRQKSLAFPPAILLRLVADACGGLHAAHELTGADGNSLNVVHRDVSPQNILVSSLGVARIIDFGIAKARDRLGDETSAGLLKGKIHYMPPEQATGGEVDRRSDVFALGAVLYQLLAGRPAYEGKSQREVLARFAAKDPPKPLPLSVHPAVAAVVLRALRHDPSERFSTAAEMQTAIEEAMVKAKLVATTADVARFAKEHLAEHARKRKETLDAAVAAAKERERTRPPPATISSSGLAPLTLTSSPGVPSSSGIMPAGSTAATGAVHVEPPPSQAKRTLVIALAALALGAVGAFMLVKTLRHPPPPKVVVESAPAASTVIIVAAPPPTTHWVPSAAASASAPPPPKFTPTVAPHVSTHHSKHRNYGF
jgi:serine/threonine protein kinase